MREERMLKLVLRLLASLPAVLMVSCMVVSVITLTGDIGFAASAKAKPKATPQPTKKSTKKTTKKKIDYNAQGLAAFGKKNYGEARRLFDLAVVHDSKNASSWVNQARVIVALGGGVDPVDYCDYPQNWIMEALSSLSRASELDAAKVFRSVSTLSDPLFRKFRERLEYKKWILLQNIPLKSAAETSLFFAKNNEWLIPAAPMPSTIVTLGSENVLTMAFAEGSRDTGTWSAETNRVSISVRSRVQILNLAATKFTYAKGSKYFRQVALVNEAGGAPWVLGPEVADCPN